MSKHLSAKVSSMICYILAKSLILMPLTTPPPGQRKLGPNGFFFPIAYATFDKKKKKKKPPLALNHKNAHNEEEDFKEDFEKYKNVCIDEGNCG